MTKLQLPNLHETIVTTFLIININNSKNLNKFELASSQDTPSQQSSLLNRSQSVSQWVSDKHSQWSDSGPIKMNIKFINVICFIYVGSFFQLSKASMHIAHIYGHNWSQWTIIVRDWLAEGAKSWSSTPFQPQRFAISDSFPKVRIEKETEFGQLAIYSSLSWLTHYDSQ